jgi:hypothetical protein
MWVMWNLILVRLEIVSVSVQDRCTVSLNVPQDQKSFWTHLMELPDDVHLVQSSFGLFGDNVNVSA